QTSRAIRWKPPVGETVKVNWDAAWMIDEYRCGIEVVIRDRCGEVLASLCCPKQNVADPAVAEIYALWRAMKLCVELNLSMVQLDGDALSVVQAVNNNAASWDWNGQLIDGLKIVLKNRMHRAVLHVNRACNSVAHSLAKSALYVKEELVWMEDYPQEIRNLVEVDKVCNSTDS
ncbi:hypothetical protein F2P56_036977, partial [Juglans regia]